MSQILKHQHLIVRALVSNPPTNPEHISTWMKNLIENIGMKIMIGPIAAYSEMIGNRGLTCVAVIETSHVAIHCWDEVEPALLQLDVYSCSELNPQNVIPMLDEFGPQKIEYQFLDRENDLHLISES